MQPETGWSTSQAAWDEFVARHPELGYRASRNTFHNFLRLHRDSLLEQDAIRLAKRRFWIAHVERFCKSAFDLATSQRPGGLTEEVEPQIGVIQGRSLQPSPRLTHHGN